MCNYQLIRCTIIMQPLDGGPTSTFPFFTDINRDFQIKMLSQSISMPHPPAFSILESVGTFLQKHTHTHTERNLSYRKANQDSNCSCLQLVIRGRTPGYAILWDSEYIVLCCAVVGFCDNSARHPLPDILMLQCWFLLKNSIIKKKINIKKNQNQN